VRTARSSVAPDQKNLRPVAAAGGAATVNRQSGSFSATQAQLLCQNMVSLSASVQSLTVHVGALVRHFTANVSFKEAQAAVIALAGTPAASSTSFAKRKIAPIPLSDDDETEIDEDAFDPNAGGMSLMQEAKAAVAEQKAKKKDKEKKAEGLPKPSAAQPAKQPSISNIFKPAAAEEKGELDEKHVDEDKRDVLLISDSKPKASLKAKGKKGKGKKRF